MRDREGLTWPFGSTVQTKGHANQAKFLINQALLQRVRGASMMSPWDRAPWGLNKLHMGAVLFLFAAAALDALVSAEAMSAPSTLKRASRSSVLTSANNGGSVDLHVGDRVTIRLRENPSTGYRWAVESVDASLVEITEGEFIPATQMMGAGGEAQWLLKAEAPGATTVKLKRWRSWEGERSIAERYQVTLRIAP